MRVPVRVDGIVQTVDVPKNTRDAIVERHTISVPHGTIQWLQPPPNECWEIQVYQVESQCSADIGTREFYQYIADRDFRTMRFEMYKTTAGYIDKYVGLPYCSGSSATVGPGDGAPMVTGTERTFVGPCYVAHLEHPCRIGILRSGLNSAADICMLHLLVRSMVQL